MDGKSFARRVVLVVLGACLFSGWAPVYSASPANPLQPKPEQLARLACMTWSDTVRRQLMSMDAGRLAGLYTGQGADLAASPQHLDSVAYGVLVQPWLKQLISGLNRIGANLDRITQDLDAMRQPPADVPIHVQMAM